MYKIICLLVVATICLEQSKAAPRLSPLSDISDKDLLQKFSQFLHEDKEVAAIIAEYKAESGHAIAKRQSESKDMTGPDMEMQPKDEGFLDRAAKFVMELMQRFLKWINTD